MNKIHTIVIVLISSFLLLIGCDMIVDRPPKSDRARPIGSDLIISEVYTISPTQNYSYSWIEILNPTNRTISWMSKATPATGYVVGEGGTILQTVDNGATWKQLSSGTVSNLNDVRFQGLSKGWAVGDNGTILSTLDSGRTWSPQASGVTSSLLSVFAPPPGTSGSPMDVVGKDGTALWSVNNGTNWDTASTGSGTRRSLHAIQYFSNDGALGVPALTVGDMGSGVYASSNSGSNWFYASYVLPESYVFTSIAVTTGKVFAGTRGGGIFLSTDNGTTWTAVNSGLANSFVQTLLLSGSNLFAGTQNGLFLSTNDGTSWSAVTSGLTNTNVQALAVSGANIFTGTQGGVFLSANNGTSWTAVNSGLPNNSNIQALAASGAKVFAGTNGSGIFRSTNNGATWTIDTTGLNNTLIVKALIYSGVNIFAGTSGGLFRSTNETTWVKSGAISSSTEVNSFAISGANILAGTSNGIYRSNNNGNTWPPFNSGLKDNIVYAVGASGSTVYAGAFTGGNIHSSADGGGSWSTGSVNPNYGYYSLSFVRENKAYIFGTNGAAFRTDDAGASWLFESTYVAGTIRGSFFAHLATDGFQDGEGWACGDNGVILKTYNEGRKWVIKNSGTSNTLNSIKFVDSLRGWAFGDRGTILYTLDGGETWSAQNSGTTANLNGSYFQALELLPEVNSSYALLIYAQRRYYYTNLNGQVNFDVITKTDTGYVLYNPLSLQYFSAGGGIKENPSQKWKISPNGFAVFYSDSGKYYDHNGQVPGNPLTISTPIAYIPDANSFQGTQGKDGFLLLQHIKSPVLWTLLPQSEVRLVRYYESGGRADSQGVSFIAAFDTTKTFYRDVDIVRLGNFQMTPTRTQELRDLFFYQPFWTIQNAPYNMYNPLDYNNNKEASQLPDKWSLTRYANDAGCTTCGAENYSQIQTFLMSYSTDRSFYLVDQPIPGYGSQRSK